MSREQDHKIGAYVLLGIAIVIILWLLSRVQGVIDGSTSTPQSSPSEYNLGGITVTGAPVNIPGSGFSLPATNNPNVFNGRYANGNCICGCDQSDAVPYVDTVVATLQQQNAIDQSNIESFIAAQDYNVSTFMNNATPTNIGFVQQSIMTVGNYGALYSV